MDKQIEAVLFHRAQAMKVRDLAKILDISVDEAEDAIETLKVNLQDRGVTLLEMDGKVMLGTTPETAVIIEKLIKDDLKRDLGKAGLETLTIVMYAAPLTRSDIDYIRGVNSSYILKNLLVRGLVERVHDKTHNKFYYRPTFELLSFIGLTKITDLPDYTEVRGELLGFAETTKGNNQSGEEMSNETHNE